MQMELWVCQTSAQRAAQLWTVHARKWGSSSWSKQTSKATCSKTHTYLPQRPYSHLLGIEWLSVPRINKCYSINVINKWVDKEWDQYPWQQSMHIQYYTCPSVILPWGLHQTGCHQSSDWCAHSATVWLAVGPAAAQLRPQQFHVSPHGHAWSEPPALACSQQQHNSHPEGKWQELWFHKCLVHVVTWRPIRSSWRVGGWVSKTVKTVTTTCSLH